MMAFRPKFPVADYLSHADFFSFPSGAKPSVPSDRIKTFSEVVAAPSNDSILIPNSNVVLPQINKSGAFHSVKINSDVYRQRLALCQHSLIARVVLNKGDNPWALPKLKARLSSLWGLKSWRLISLGRGFYHILLSAAVDKDLV